jgi:ABC-type transport system involved in multi-copper enzyme maturation permease subunit
MAGPPLPIPPGVSTSPFGWTGIRREKYTRWKGKLDGRDKIVRRMITEGVRFNMKNLGVVALVVLAWLFSMLFPVLQAGMGGLPLEADNPSTFSGTESTAVSMHLNITNTSVAVYPLVGANLTYQTKFFTEKVPQGWSAAINVTPDGPMVRASLLVRPPVNPAPFDYAWINVSAETGGDRGRQDTFSTVTMVVPNPMMALDQSAYQLAFAKSEFSGKAGDSVDASFYINNTGTVTDSYEVTFRGMASHWKTEAYINGTKATVMTKEVGPPGMPREFRVKVSYIMVTVQPGSSALCALKFKTTADSPAATAINVGVKSGNDMMVSGEYVTSIVLKDTKKMDLTGAIFLNSVMGIMPFFALLLAAVVGSRMIATDLAEKSYNLYFARPLTKKDYIIGKFGTVSIILAMVTMVPSLICYALVLMLTSISNTYIIDHLWVWGAIIGYSLVMILTFGTMSLAFSSLTPRRFYAAAAVVVIYLVTAIVGQIASFAFNSDYGRLISLGDDMNLMGMVAFQQMADVTLKFPWYDALAVLAVLWFVCGFLVWYRVDRTELSE